LHFHAYRPNIDLRPEVGEGGRGRGDEICLIDVPRVVLAEEVK